MITKTIVHKFGGTSVGSAERFASVADIVEGYPTRFGGEGFSRSVVVVSAMSGVTNQLHAGVRAAAEGRETDYDQTIAELLDRGIIPVITGFIAATQSGVTTTLGRGGSDYFDHRAQFDCYRQSG